MRSNLLLTSNVCTADVVISARTLQFVAVDLDKIVFIVFFLLFSYICFKPPAESIASWSQRLCCRPACKLFYFLCVSTPRLSQNEFVRVILKRGIK